MRDRNTTYLEHIGVIRIGGILPFEFHLGLRMTGPFGSELATTTVGEQGQGLISKIGFDILRWGPRFAWGVTEYELWVLIINNNLNNIFGGEHCGRPIGFQTLTLFQEKGAWQCYEGGTPGGEDRVDRTWSPNGQR